MSAADAAALSALIRSRRSVRDFLPRPIPQEVLDAVLEDASWAPSWSNTQPYRVAVASGVMRDRLAAELCGLFDRGMAAQHGGALAKLKLLLTRKGLPDGDFDTQFTYPDDLQPRRRETGRGLYDLLGIGHHDRAARDSQMRRNFQFFGAPTALFLFAHRGLREEPGPQYTERNYNGSTRFASSISGCSRLIPGLEKTPGLSRNLAPHARPPDAADPLPAAAG